MMPHDQIGQMAEAGLIYLTQNMKRSQRKQYRFGSSRSHLERQSLCLPLCRRVTSSLL